MTRKIMDLMSETDDTFSITFFLVVDKISAYFLGGRCTIQQAAGFICNWFTSEYYKNADPNDYNFVMIDNKFYIFPKKDNEPIRFIKPE